MNGSENTRPRANSPLNLALALRTTLQRFVRDLLKNVKNLPALEAFVFVCRHENFHPLPINII